MNLDLTTINDSMLDFRNHEEARSWFKSLFQERFLFRTYDKIDGKMLYYYHIVKNPETYQQYMQSLASEVKQENTNMETFESYSTVEINEEGEVSLTI